MIAGILTLLTFSVIETAQGMQNAPQLQNVHGDPSTQRIDVGWTDALSEQNKIIYEIEVYDTGQKEPTYREIVERGPSLTHQWHWTSSLPLQCLPHSVRLRRHNASDWTELWNVTGSGSDHAYRPEIYPKLQNSGAYLVGSRKKFCCIIPDGTMLKKLTYNKTQVKKTCVGQTCLFDLVLEPTSTFGFDIICEVTKTKPRMKHRSGSSVFVGSLTPTSVFVFNPDMTVGESWAQMFCVLTDSPQVYNFTCHTRNLRLLECLWKQGNDRNLKGKRRTLYNLNGSSCDPPENEILKKCSIKITPNEGEVAWTLTAKNPISETIFTYVANPRHRVYLPAPELHQVSQVHSRNATIQWHWPDANLENLQIRCELHVWKTTATEPEELLRREETGVGLHSITLHDLHPYTRYSGRVRCASAEYFWKWGDWSKEFTFQTKDDIPQAVNVWMAVNGSNRFVIWKMLAPEQSHGELKEYELSWGGSHPQRLNPDEQCYNMRAGSAEKTITITALNSVGQSQPSAIRIPSHTRDVKTTRVKSSNGTLELTWSPSPNGSCGYVVDWYPVLRRSMCDIDWIKIPAGHTNVTIKSGLDDGVRYIFSLYACTSEAPELLQRWEGYGREQAPSEAPSHFHAAQDGMDVVLTWGKVPLAHHRGFIQGYVINYALRSHDNNKWTTEIVSVSDGMQWRIRNLRADSYDFTICAFTSGGRGRDVKTTAILTSQISQVIVYSIISLGAVITLFLLFTILCYWKRAWLKDKVYPTIPAPYLDWNDSEGIHGCKPLAFPTECVEPLTAFPISVSDPSLKVTNNVPTSVLLPLYNITDSQPSAPTDKSIIRLSVSELDNPIYHLQTSTDEPRKAAPVAKSVVATSVATKQGYKAQLPPLSTSKPLCTNSSYQEFNNVCQGGVQQQTAWTSQLECDDYTAVGLLGSPTSISSSQPLLDSCRFGYMDSN